MTENVRGAISDLSRLAEGEPFDVKHIVRRWKSQFAAAPRVLTQLAKAVAEHGTADRASASSVLHARFPEIAKLLRCGQLRRVRYDLEPPTCSPCWPTPAMPTFDDLARTLETPPAALYRLLRSLSCRDDADARQRHYRFEWIPKRPTGARLLEAPKARLKALQRILHRKILRPIPMHSAAHGFVSGRSVLTFAAPHVGMPFVLRLDLRHFFASIGRGRVVRIFRTAGYPRATAEALATLATMRTPADVWACCPSACDLVADDRWRRRYAAAHLPQGAPTSPALANLAARRFDRRALGLAARWGVRYTRYADDLAFSGARNFQRSADEFVGALSAVAEDEGFCIHPRKTQRMSANGRQELAGLTVNAKLNVGRRAYEELKAILHNCARFGPSSQNRTGLPGFRERLRGRIAHVAHCHSSRGEKLLRLFAGIDWSK